MSRLLKRISFAMAALTAVLVLLSPLTAVADVPYQTYSQNGYGEFIKSQTAYTPFETIYKITDAENGDVYYLSNPEDMYLAGDGNIYIADTGNDRIVVCDRKGNFVNIIGNKDTLYRPSGVYVQGDYVYVCVQKEDRRSLEGYVAVFDKKGNFVKKYGKPESVLFGNSSYKPKKLIVDNGGYLYIVSDGNTNGIVQLTPDGEFLGYFGTGEVLHSLMDIIYNLILSDDQKAGRISRAPQSMNNLCIDRKGVIYTLISGNSMASQPLRKLNKAGTNMLLLEVFPRFGTAVAVGQYENIYVAASTGYIYEFNKEGTLLFCFGGEDDTIANRKGIFQAAAIMGIGVDENDRIYILDNKANTIEIFKTTEFTDNVHQSLLNYQKGDYIMTKKYLNNIMNMNSMYDYANQAMGATLFRELNYKESMKFYRLAKDKLGYSESYWEIRNKWLTGNIIIVILAIAGIVVIMKILGFFDKKYGMFNFVRKGTAGLRGTMAYKRLMFGKRFMRHPIDGAYDIRHYRIASISISAVLVVIYTLIYIVNKYFAGFIVKTVRDGRYNIMGDVLLVVVGFAAASIVTYLICTINDGEGRYKEILSGFVYAFTPYAIIQPILFLAGQVITFNEMFIMEFGNIIMMSLIAILIFIALKEINNYSVKETFKVIFLTAFTALIFALIIFVIYILSQQFINFVISIYGEVVYRLDK